MYRIGNYILALGFALIGIGAIGTTVLAIIAAFGVAMHLGFLAILVAGLAVTITAIVATQ